MPASSQSILAEHDFASQATTVSVSRSLRSTTPTIAALDLSNHPAIYVLPQGLTKNDLSETLDKLKSLHANVVLKISEARWILSYAKAIPRAKHDLASERFEDIGKLSAVQPLSFRSKEDFGNDKDRNNSSSHSEPTNPTESDATLNIGLIKSCSPQKHAEAIGTSNQSWNISKIAVIRLKWLYDSIKEENLLSVNDYILLEGPWLPRQNEQHNTTPKKRHYAEYNEEFRSPVPVNHPRTAASQASFRKRALLSQETTEELEAIEQRPVPDWVRKQIKYSCLRKQCQPTENEDFLTELRLIKHKRTLDGTHDEKIRNSYGRAIASIGAYPYHILHPSELEKLPQCGDKFGKMFRHFQDFGSLEEADIMRTDPKLQTLDLFWNIHGIGPHAANMLYDKGYRTIDGLRYKVWPSLIELVEDDPAEKIRLDSLEDPGLEREQQQGLKFYDDFLEKVPRSEVEKIASIVEQHLREVTDERAQAMLVGSYRKGKPTSGDVDIVVSHPDETMTANLVNILYESLEAEGWIRAKLKISLAHTHRDQKPVFNNHKGVGGFGALDIALLVWQDTAWPTKEKDLAEDPDARNPATCRRVDIIVSPWKSVGCAVLGWSGGITFERDLREYVDKELHYKFDSSGVVDRKTGKQVDIEKYEDPTTRARTIAEAERRVIEGLGLRCFDPRERLTD